MTFTRSRKTLTSGTAMLMLSVVFATSHAVHGSTEFLPQAAQLVGDWTGDSICQVKPSSCHDEKVVYHISKGSDEDHVVVSADRIVDGKAINMRSITFSYDRKAATLLNDSDGRVWRFKVEGTRMTGTLTMPDQTVFRRVTLEKQK